MVDQDKERYPDAYRRSWVLTSIIGTYLAAEALRAIRGDEDLTTFAVAYASDPSGHRADAELARDAARKTLAVRRDQKRRDGDSDDFKVDFKNEQILRELGIKAREFAIVLTD